MEFLQETEDLLREPHAQHISGKPERVLPDNEIFPVPIR